MNVCLLAVVIVRLSMDVRTLMMMAADRAISSYVTMSHQDSILYHDVSHLLTLSSDVPVVPDLLSLVDYAYMLSASHHQ